MLKPSQNRGRTRESCEKLFGTEDARIESWRTSCPSQEPHEQACEWKPWCGEVLLGGWLADCALREWDAERSLVNNMGQRKNVGQVLSRAGASQARMGTNSAPLPRHDPGQGTMLFNGRVRRWAGVRGIIPCTLSHTHTHKGKRRKKAPGAKGAPSLLRSEDPSVLSAAAQARRKVHRILLAR